MPGKHAPASPRSFYLSVARAVTGALAVLALVVLIAFAAVGSNDPKAPVAGGTPTPTQTQTAKAQKTPTTTATPSEDGTPSPDATASELRARSRVTILVLNATDRAGLAGRIRQRLLDKGYERVTVGNDENRARSVVYYRGGYRPEATRAANDIDGLSRIRSAPESLDGSARVTIILGGDFRE